MGPIQQAQWAAREADPSSIASCGIETGVVNRFRRVSIA
jgi:hypothetical protein